MYQIDDTFTRLSPGITFFECVPRTTSISTTGSTADSDAGSNTGHALSASDTPCVLGEPPKKFTGVHCAAHINAWYARLGQCLAEPVQLEQRKGHRRVGLLGTAVFDFDPDGLLGVYAWDFDENDRVMLAELPPHSVAIEGAPHESLGMRGFERGALRAIRQRHPGQAALCRAYLAWAKAQLSARLWTEQTQERVRYQVAVALDLDVWAAGVAGQIQLTALPEQPMRASLYNHALRHRAGLETIQKEAPELMVLYALMAEAVENTTEPYEVTQRMALLLKNKGIQPATWRLLCRSGTHWMKEFLAYYNFERDTPLGIACDILLIAQAFGTHELAPPWLLQGVLQLGGNPNAPLVNYVSRLDDLFPLCKRLGHLWAQADEITQALLKARAQDIFGWASDHLEHTPEDYVRRATLRGLIRKVDEQDCVDALRLQGAQSWQVPYELDLHAQNAQAVILDSPLAIWEEGRDMRHCADNYIGACECGRLVMVSLRQPQRNRSLATVTFEVRPRKVALHKISGFANSLVGPEVLQMARECQRQLQQQRNKLGRQTQEAA